jgi:hypothetical protein
MRAAHREITEQSEWRDRSPIDSEIFKLKFLSVLEF